MATHTGMRVQSVRFSHGLWETLGEEAREQGISTSQYIREAAIARLWLDLGRRPEHELTERVTVYLDMARRLEAGD